MEKDNEIQLTKSQMDLNNWRTKNHPPSPVERKDNTKLLCYELRNLMINHVEYISQNIHMHTSIMIKFTVRNSSSKKCSSAV